MAEFSPAPRGAREELIGSPLAVKLDRSMAAGEVQACLADALPGLAAELEAQSSARDPLRRWRLLSALGRTDLVLARLLEGHLDARAILAEAGRSAVAGALYGVWASASGGTGLTLASVGSDERGTGPPQQPGVTLSGIMRFCSGAPLLDRALTTSRNEAGELLLLDIGVRGRELRTVSGSWPALGMDASQSVDIEIHDLQVDPDATVGHPGFYLDRPGLYLGGIGVAAVWLGGLQGLLDATLRLFGHRRPDDHDMAHIGAVTVAIESAAATLVSAAARLRAGPIDPSTELSALPLDTLARLALICRSAVEAAVDVGTRRLPRVAGPVGVARDGDLAHRLADLEVFVRQHHAERDLARLGAAEFSEPWSDGSVSR